MPTDEFWVIPGWRAMETALAEAFPGRLAGVYRTPQSADPAEWPLVAVLIHALERGYHYCGLGLSDLDEKSYPESEESGWGFELTFRLVCAAGDEGPPTWPIALLQTLTRIVLSRQVGFFPNHHLPLGQPILPGSRLQALLFANDAALAPLKTPFGTVVPTQVIGITSDEEGLIAEWSCTRFLEVIRRSYPALETDPGRRSWLEDPQLGPALREAAEREGSALDGISADHVRWTADGPRFVVELGPSEAVRTNIPRVFRGRTRHGRTFTIHGPTQKVAIFAGARPHCAPDGATLNVTLDEAARLEIERELPRLADDRPWSPVSAPGLVVKLVDTSGH